MSSGDRRGKKRNSNLPVQVGSQTKRRMDAGGGGGAKIKVEYSGFKDPIGKMGAGGGGGAKIEAEYSGLKDPIGRMEAGVGGGHIEAEYSGMKEPPLIKQLKRILSEYPDNGQIIKELIQNAEDAEAREVKVIYDTRCINDGYNSDEHWFTKFFKGPALCVTNDAEFTEKDWTGIKMIASSVKEENRLKVGRFGMGFKSVFHMTDFPCILSGDRILCIDPTGASDKINAEMKLKDLRRYIGMDVDAFFKAFGETIGVDHSVIESGHYSGTAFWFPLRCQPSNVSSTVYNHQKTMDLFMSFAHDASETLLFLCHLVKVSVSTKRGDSEELEEVITAAIVGDIEGIIEKRSSFIKSIEEKKSMDHEPIICTYDLTVNIHQSSEERDAEWRIIHYYMGENASQQLKKLATDPSLGFCQCVGLALPLNSSAHDHFESRVFCFMPLPKDIQTQTGLPVHVNGFFALSQNRHHLKWPTEDQLNQDITDRDIIWNQLLIDECLTEAYKELMKQTKDTLISHGRLHMKDVGLLYRLIPNQAEVVEKWTRILQPMKVFLGSFEFLYSSCKKKFVALKCAHFAVLKDLPSNIEHIKADIVKTLETLDVTHVSIDEDTFETLSYYSDSHLNNLTPEKLAKLLRNDAETMHQLPPRIKYSILSYLLSGKDDGILESLRLIPTAGDWQAFERSENFIYISRIQEVPALFPTFKDRVIVRTEGLVNYVWDEIENMANNGVWQIRTISPSVLSRFIKDSVAAMTGNSGAICDSETFDRLRKIWEFIDAHTDLIDLEQLKDVTLIPEITKESFTKSVNVTVYTMRSLFLERTGVINTDAIESFGLLGVQILPTLPDWIPKHKFENCIFSPEDRCLETLLGRVACLADQDSIVNYFNSKSTIKNKDELLKFLFKCEMFDKDTVCFLKRLELFQQMSKRSENIRHVAASDKATYFISCDFPVEIPRLVIQATKKEEQRLLAKFGINESTVEEVIMDVCIEIVEQSSYTDKDIDIFMDFFLNMSGRFQSDHPVISYAKEIPFLNASGRKRPRQVFDPTDKILRDLFEYEDERFPHLGENVNEQRISALKRLGLKDVSSLTAEDIVSSAKKLEDPRVNDKEKIRRKSRALMGLLEDCPSLLQRRHENEELWEILRSMKWVHTSPRPEHLPPSLPTYSDILCRPCDAKMCTFKNECLISTVVPLVPKNFKKLGELFGWSDQPLTEDIVKQLIHIKKCLKIEEKSSVVSLINQIYRRLSSIAEIPSSLHSEAWIWVGDRFVKPESVVVSTEKGDIESITPYFFNVPTEFTRYKQMFMKAGCHEGQTHFVLMQTLQKIQAKHKQSQHEEEYEKDFELTLKVIHKLAEKRKYFDKNVDVLLPVKSNYCDRIIFVPASKSTVDKGSHSYTMTEGDESIVFVNDRLPIEVAKALGAKPLNKQILSGTENIGIVGFGQEEKLTDRLKKLVQESYKDGVSVPKELIQNADDAGATVVKFLFDERDHKTRTLFSSESEQCQGPALLVFNDAAFSNSDMENIRKLNAATKESDACKIGRFGLGFCSVYNLTDVPSFVTRTSFVMFDPNKTHLADFVEDNSPGIRIDFNRYENHKLLKLYEDQFAPFNGIFGFEKSSLKAGGFQGTLFRFPLRTSKQALTSEIMKQEYGRREIVELLEMFVQEACNLLLFTQNVVKLELHHIPKNADSEKDQVLLFETLKQGLEIVDLSPEYHSQGTVLRKASEAIEQQGHLKEIHKFTIDAHKSEFGKVLLPKLFQATHKSQIPWIVAWETLKSESERPSIKQDSRRALPLACTAALCTPGHERAISLRDVEQLSYNSLTYNCGHFFCFLPLPITTGLNIHINCPFDTTSDRQRLSSATADDKVSLQGEWNQHLLTYTVVNSLFTLLEFMAMNEMSTGCYYRLWPIVQESVTESLHTSFFKRLVQEDRPLFYGQGRFVPFSGLVYLDHTLRNHPIIGDMGFQMLLNVAEYENKAIVDIPFDVLEILKNYIDIKSSCIGEKDFFEILLNNITHEYWGKRNNERNELLVCAITLGNETVLSLMKNKACIPVEPNGTLKRPGETVDPKGKVKSLFEEEDEVFPLYMFHDENVRKPLKQIGMMSKTLPEEVLRERCSTIEKLALSHCAQSALVRCRRILQYIKVKYYANSEGMESMDIDSASFVNSFRDAIVLPVLPKPNMWNFTWHACTDTRLIHCDSSSCYQEHSVGSNIPILFGKPAILVKPSKSITVGSVACILDEESLGDVRFPIEFWEILGVNICPSIELVMKQLMLISGEFESGLCSNFADILNDIYKFLHEAIVSNKNDNALKSALQTLSDKAVILLGEDLVCPNTVAFNVYYECRPFLNRLPRNDSTRYGDLFRAIGVRDHFSADDILAVMKMKIDKWQGSVCTEIDTIIGLLQNLSNCPCVDFSSQSIKDFIVAPDMYGRLSPIHELVIADDTFDTDIHMQIVHNSVPPSLARNLGAKRKKQKCLESLFSTIGKHFGQKEKLVSRLGNLLRAYPCDSSIMKELLQNADDARANILHFIKDFRAHSTDRIFADECKDMQGPALCVFNNTFFTEDDLEGIQTLGEGSKREDPTKTGQYGVGFNAVYHLTDTPSFLTKGPNLPGEGLLCIFDPTCRHIPGVKPDNPGIQCEVAKLRRNFPGVLLGFHERHMDDVGTLFRFPLRKNKSDISKNCLTPESLNCMLTDMTEDMFDSLLFVKNVEQIRISDISSGSFEEEYCVTAEISDEDSSKKADFYHEIKELSRKLKQKEIGLGDSDTKETSYNIKVSDTHGRNESFFVALKFGFEKSSNLPKEVIDAFANDDLGCLPLGGVAFRTSGLLPCSSKAFCFLPLPGNTGLPVNINGHFALNHESRRELWKGHNYRQIWNECMIRNIIVPAYVKCIYHLKVLVSKNIYQTVEMKVTEKVEETLHEFNNIFPDYIIVENDYWKLLTTHLYNRIVEGKEPLFPVVGLKPIACDWVPLGSQGETCNGYFRYPYEDREYLSIENGKKLDSILNRIGMKIIRSPLKLKTTMEQSGVVGLLWSSPDEVLRFVATSSTCKINQQVINIKDSPLETIENLSILLMYLSKSNEFQNRISDLPLLLTNDGNLRLFRNVEPIYMSSFGTMFPESQNRFIHSVVSNDQKLQSIIKLLLSKGHLRKLTLEAFKGFIPKRYKDLLDGGVPFISRNGVDIPPPEWIKNFWMFIYETNNREKRQMVSFKDNTLVFANWCLIPAVRVNEPLLVQVNHAFILIDIDSYLGQSSLHGVLQKLSLPILDKRINEPAYYGLSCIFKEWRNLVTSYYHPERLLDCLCFWVQNEGPQVIQNTVGENDVVALLKHLAAHFTHSGQNCFFIQKLRALPLFVSITKSLYSLNGNFDLYVVPSCLPLEGLDVLMVECDVVLLKTFKGLKELYNAVSLSVTRVDKLYADIILPNIHRIPEDLWMHHITFLKDLYFRHWSQENNNNWNSIIEALKEIPFIQTPHGLKKCSDFYHHQEKVFETMCNSSKFLPNAFRENNWPEFISVLGMKTEVSDEMMITFAEEIASNNNYTPSTKLREQSKVVSKYFINSLDKWHTDTLNKLKDIRFIQPVSLPETFQTVFHQKKDDVFFICTNGSALKRCASLCWSTLHVLPFDIPIEKQNILGITSISRNVEVLKHIQNVSTVLQNQIKDMRKEDVTVLIRAFYEYLSSNIDDNNITGFNAKNMLYEFPIIHLPNEVEMVKVSDVVINLPRAVELKPYLFNAPHNYGEFFLMFERLGVLPELQYWHCVNVLFKIYVKANQETLLSGELRYAKGAIERLHNLFETGTSTDRETPSAWGNQKLYLPNTNKVMCASTELVFCDNARLKERASISNLVKYFIGFSQLELASIDVVTFVKCLPEHLRPKLLTNIVIERFDTIAMEEVQDSLLASRLSSFIRSTEFVIGLCRIAKKFVEEKGEQFDRNKYLKYVKDTVLKIHVKEVKQLETFLEHNGEILPGTRETRPCFHEQHGEKMTFYFKRLRTSVEDILSDILCSTSGLPLVLVHHIDGLPHEATMIILAVLRKYSDPNGVGQYLDEERFPSLEMDTGIETLSAFPKPGTYVDENLHPFLEQALTLFEESEFLNVALQLEDGFSDEHELEASAVYIYVHITREIEHPLGIRSFLVTKYLVDIGADEHVEVPAYRLYRFVRRQETTSEVAIYTGNTTEHYLPFDENSRRLETLLREAWGTSEDARRRIIRRLLLQWHPDKNRGKEEYARRIFDFIKQLIQTLVEEEQANASRHSTHRSSSRPNYYFNVFANVERRARNYARAYHNNLHEYNRCHGTGNYSHSAARNAVVKDEYEARRWMKQAKHDFRAAKQFFEVAEDPNAYNWICYTCHQASEKALKAYQYATNANVLTRFSHQTTWIACGMPEPLPQLADQLESHVGQYSRMRYPSVFNRPQIPAEIFTKEHAEKAIELARSILDNVDDLIS